jgi:hypothetical protein
MTTIGEEFTTMANIIAVVWDCDKTLLSEYMEDPVFRAYGVDSNAFWKETNELVTKYRTEQNVKVNPDTIYLNQFITYTKNGIFSGLNNKKLREFGKKLKFYPGVPEIFDLVRNCLNDNPDYEKYDIKVEHYVVSTGLSEMVRGSRIADLIDGLWGCEFIEDRSGETPIISEVGYTIDNTTKTRALFEINKGVGKNDGVDVNTTIPEDHRRVHFENIIYVADGPSDIPAFSLTKKNGGSTMAVYPEGDMKALTQVEQLRKDGRVDMLVEADYRKGHTASMWLCNKVHEIADRIVRTEEAKLRPFTEASVIRHLN